MNEARTQIHAILGEDTDFLEWIYHTKSTDFSALSENTSLQKNVKKHLLTGGVISNSYGRLKRLHIGQYQ